MIVETKINENSERMRPTELRNEKQEPLPKVEPGALKGGTVKPEDVAARVVRAIERRDLYILTHPEQREFLRRRANKIDQMFEPDKW
jgi:hypothetical protein